MIDNKELYQIAKSKSIEAILKLNSANPHSIGTKLIKWEKAEQTYKPKIKPSLAKSRGTSPTKCEDICDFATEIKAKILYKKDNLMMHDVQKSFKREDEDFWNLSTQEDSKSEFGNKSLKKVSKVIINNNEKLNEESSQGYISFRQAAQLSPCSYNKYKPRLSTQSPTKTIKSINIFENLANNSSPNSPYGKPLRGKRPKTSKLMIPTKQL